VVKLNATDLLEIVKSNLIIQFDDDDSILTSMIVSAINYAEGFQNRATGYYANNDISPATTQAIILLASYFYETRDATGGTFFLSGAGAIGSSANNMWRSVNDLLRLDRDWMV
jgi:uncharacterized phage protein (predicted DNA packaging)